MLSNVRLSFVLSAALASAAAIAGGEPARQPPQGRTTTTYSCGASPAGACSYLLYTSDCKEGAVKNGYPALVCTHEVFAEFSLKPGESKTFDRLPPGVKQCQLPKGRKVFADCMR